MHLSDSLWIVSRCKITYFVSFILTGTFNSVFIWVIKSAKFEYPNLKYVSVVLSIWSGGLFAKIALLLNLKYLLILKLAFSIASTASGYFPSLKVHIRMNLSLTSLPNKS
jgi:hypothetical protein